MGAPRFTETAIQTAVCEPGGLDVELEWRLQLGELRQARAEASNPTAHPCELSQPALASRGLCKRRCVDQRLSGRRLNDAAEEWLGYGSPRAYRAVKSRRTQFHHHSFRSCSQFAHPPATGLTISTHPRAA